MCLDVQREIIFALVAVVKPEVLEPDHEEVQIALLTSFIIFTGID